MPELADEQVEPEEINPEASETINTTDQNKANQVTNIIPCPFCQEPISANAKKCKHCGDYLDFRGKAWWAVLGLIIIPLTLAVIGFFLAEMQDRRQVEIEEGHITAQTTIEANRAMSNTLESYIDDVSAIILEKNLKDEKVLSTIRARTVSTIRELDYPRNVTVIEFLTTMKMIGFDSKVNLLKESDLRGADLVEVDLRTVDLREIDLSGADLSRADLTEADLSGADLSKADLIGTSLTLANLSFCDLSFANLSFTDLIGANLSGADLNGANLSGADLSTANLSVAHLTQATLSGADLNGADLNGAYYNANTIWPEGFDPTAARAILINE